MRYATRLVGYYLLVLVLAAPQLTYAEPVSAATAITTAVQVLKDINELNRAILEGQQLQDITARLARIEAQLGRIEDKLDEVAAAIQELDNRVEEQWQRERRGDIVGTIRMINAYYPGWITACKKGSKIKCDADTIAEIRGFHTTLVTARSRFMEKDDYSNIHITVLAMGYERDLLVLLNGQKHAKAVFTQYARYLDGGLAHLEVLRTKAQDEVTRLEKAAESWSVTEDWCNDNCETYTWHHQDRKYCKYCAVVKFSGNIRQGWTRTSGFGARDGQGLLNCYDDRDTTEPRGPRTALPAMYSASCDAYSPIGNVSCETLKEHRNCRVLDQLIASRVTYMTLTTQTIPDLNTLKTEVAEATELAKRLASGKLI